MQKICKICNNEFKSNRSFVLHLKKHGIKHHEYYIKYENLKIPKCIVCGNDAEIRQGLVFRKICYNKDCKDQLKKKIWTNELKNKQSKIISSTIKNNFWKKTYRGVENNLEKQFRLIIEKFDFETFQFYKSEEFERLYELDFAIPSLKIGFEINGNQHYDKSGNLSPYYKERHDLIESKGWKLVEIPYLECYNKQHIKEIIINVTNGIEIDYIKPVKRVKRVKLETNKREKRKLNDDLIKNRINKIIESDINFNKYGWVKEVSILLNISHTSVTKWMIKYMNDFYKTCYKRGNSLNG